MPANVRVFSFKAGLLARLAHDLELNVRRFEIKLEQRRVDAWFDADSLEVAGVVSAGRLDRSVLSDDDRAKIAGTLRSELLRAPQYPRIAFSGEVTSTDPLRVDGALTLRGHAESLSFAVDDRHQQLQASIPLAPSRFGIAPYKTLGGAIRLQDRVEIVVTLQLAEADPRTILEKSEATYFRPDHSA